MPDQEFLKEIASQLRKPNGEFGKEVAEKMNESNCAMNLATINALKIETGNTILEMGMGNGFFVKDILSKTDRIHYIGCDYSEDMVTLSAQMNQRFIDSGKATFFQAEAHDLPLYSNSIDKLFTVNTLYFWEEKKAILSEFRRVLKPYGTLCISIRQERCLKKYPSTQHNFEHYTTNEVSKLLSKHGYSVINIIEKEEPEVEILEQKIIPEYAIIIAQKA